MKVVFYGFLPRFLFDDLALRVVAVVNLLTLPA